MEKKRRGGGDFEILGFGENRRRQAGWIQLIWWTIIAEGVTDP